MNKALVNIAARIALLGLVVIGCSGNEIRSLEELEQMAQNPTPDLRKEVVQGPFKFTINYLPPEVLLLNEYKYLEELKERGAEEEAIQKQIAFINLYKKSYASTLQFKVIITPEDGSDLIYEKMQQGFGAYSEWLQKLLFGIKEEITLVTPDGQEVPLIGYQMDRNYGVAKSRSFLLTFPKSWNGKEIEEHDSFKIRIDEFGLGTGRVTVKYSTPLPNITLSETYLTTPS
ncbi:MAG: hypothetical protein ACMZ7B_01675 [Balneola sp.]